ncbi:RINT1-like protein MAG2 [Bienertia sinuspersici]
MESSPENLPEIKSLSPSVISFLNATFLPKHDLNLSETIHSVSELETRCSELTHHLANLTRKLDANLESYASYSHQIDDAFHHVHRQLQDLHSKPSSSDGKLEEMVADELPALAKEVARIEMEVLISAINSLKSIEDLLALVMRAHPRWVRLVTAADHRVDRALAILRPQAIADHRALLVSAGWPPPLSTLGSSNVDGSKPSEVSNPLSTMPGELKQKYCQSFLALCSVQGLQRQRKSRQLEGYNRDVSLYQPLWKWVDKPEFIFALVSKNIRDYIDSVDELLQPLVDEAMLTGYSCREEWISAMVTSLSTHLAKEIFPAYLSRLDGESALELRSQTRMSFLHLVDLMIAFDKKIQALAAHSGILVSIEDYSLLQRMSSLSVFCDRPDWLDLWAQIELENILEKLKPEMEDERNWSVKSLGAALFSGSEDYKSPQSLTVADHCLLCFLRSRFVRLVGAPIIDTFLNGLLTKCLEAEALTALADDDAVARVMMSVNSAHHIKSVLIEWCDDIIFVEMGLEDDNELGNGNGVVDKIKNVVLRGFDAQIRDYIKNKKQWQEKIEEGWTVTKSFVTALDYLQGKMCILEEGFNGRDFTAVWRSLANGIDRLIYNGVLMSNAKFYSDGVERFQGDMNVLFGVFRSWCLRPEGFFPRVSEGLKLLKMEEHHLQGLSTQGEEWMKHNGIRHLSIAEAEKIVKCRVFGH